MKSKLHLNTQFCLSRPLKDWNREMELKGLQYLLERLVKQEKYEVAELARQRIHEVKQQMVKMRPSVINFRYSLN